MKQQSHHHEILLVTGTTLSSEQFVNNNGTNKEGKLASIEELRRACWNVVLHDMFPEMLGNVDPKENNTLWHASTGKNILYVSIGPDPLAAEHNTSIDPYFFMMNICGN
jgi:hypothetical protein